MNAFTPAASARLDGPAWLRDRRATAAATFAASELPTTAEEVWRYSRIDEVSLDGFSPADPTADPAEPGGALGELTEWAAAPIAATVVVVDGRVTRLEVHPDAAAAGLEIIRLAEDGAAEPVGLEALDDAPDVFVTLNEAFTADPILVRVPRSAEIAGVVHVVRISATAEVASFGRLHVEVGDNASLSLIEHHRSGAERTFTAPFTELLVGDDARLAYLAVDDLGPAALQLGTLVAKVGKNGDISAASAGFGGDYVRLRTDCRLEGRAANGNLLAVYFGDDDQMLDYRTFQDHRARDTTSDLLFNGAVGGRARSVYTGMIKVRPEGRNTDAMQTNRNLKLSEEAWAESVPNLEIETNDVRCTHASSVGPIDEDQRFYLESRGVRPGDAERLIMTGYFEEVIDRIAVPGVADPLRARIRAKVAARVAAGEVTV